MAVTFPLSVDYFMDDLLVRSVRFSLPEALEMSRTAAGEIGTASIGTRLWHGEVTLGRLTRSEAQDAEALIDLARGAEASFMAYPKHRVAPINDASGALLGTATVQIMKVPADARMLQLKGLPIGYELRRGDYLAFEYRSDPTRFALHRIQDASVIADGLGRTAAFEVRPHIRPGAAVDATVQLVKPACKVKMVPDSLDPGRTNRFVTEGISFSFVQTLR